MIYRAVNDILKLYSIRDTDWEDVTSPYVLGRVNVTIEMNDNINIFAGQNDSGKTTILEALAMVLTGKINGSNIVNRLNLDWFNAKVRQDFKDAIKAGNTPVLPIIEIEAYFLHPVKMKLRTYNKYIIKYTTYCDGDVISAIRLGSQKSILVSHDIHFTPADSIER